MLGPGPTAVPSLEKLLTELESGCVGGPTGPDGSGSARTRAVPPWASVSVGVPGAVSLWLHRVFLMTDGVGRRVLPVHRLSPEKRLLAS